MTGGTKLWPGHDVNRGQTDRVIPIIYHRTLFAGGTLYKGQGHDYNNNQ